MQKPILATNLDGFLINSKAFTEPHKEWFKRAIKKTKDKSLKKWINHPEYFLGVNEAMKQIMPNASPQKRTKKARKWYQQDVIKYIKENPKMINSKTKIQLIKLKQKYTLALITTNTDKYIKKILKSANLNKIYKIIHATKVKEKPNKLSLFKDFIKKYGKPKYFLTTKEDKDLDKLLKKHKIKKIKSLKEVE